MKHGDKSRSLPLQVALLLSFAVVPVACSDTGLYGSSNSSNSSPGSASAPVSVQSSNAVAASDGAAPPGDSGKPTTAAGSPTAVSPAPGAPAPAPAPAAPMATTTDTENTKATAPQLVTGAFLVDCGPAGTLGDGCVIRDAKTKMEAAFTFLANPQVTISYSDKTVEHATATLAPSSSPWHFTFQPSPLRVEMLKSLVVSVSTNLGCGTFTAETLGYVPPVPGSATTKPAAPVFAAADSIFFVTSQTYVPGPTPTATRLNFNGAAAADALCQAIADAADAVVPANRKWMAYLSLEALNHTSASAANKRITPLKSGGNMVDSAGDLIIAVDDYNDFKVFSSAIGKDATATAVASGAKIWTGTDSGNNPIAGSTCSNWTVSASGSAEYGVVSKGPDWTYAGSVACSQPQHLYCVGTVP